MNGGTQDIGIQTTSPVSKKWPADNGTFKAVEMGYAVIVTSSSLLRFIGTWGVSPCSTIIFHNYETKETLFAHLQAPEIHTVQQESESLYQAELRTRREGQFLSLERYQTLKRVFKEIIGHETFAEFIIPGSSSTMGPFIAAQNHVPLTLFEIPRPRGGAIIKMEAEDIFFDRNNSTMVAVLGGEAPPVGTHLPTSWGSQLPDGSPREIDAGTFLFKIP